jgi:hypothetical protein
MNRADRIEAEGLLSVCLAGLRQRPFSELVALIESPCTVVFTGPSGRNCQIEVCAIWEATDESRLRVYGTIDDGGATAYLNSGRLVQCFFAFPDGTTE